MVFLFMLQPNLIIPSYVFLIEVWLVKILFQNRISIKSYRGKTFRGWPRLPPPPRSGKVKFIYVYLENTQILTQYLSQLRVTPVTV